MLAECVLSVLRPTEFDGPGDDMIAAQVFAETLLMFRRSLTKG